MLETMTVCSEIASEKQRLRQRAAAARGAIDLAAARQAALRLERQVLALPEISRAEHVLTCLSFGNEIDTWALTESLLRDDKKVYIPRAWRGERRLTVHPYPCALETLGMGLRQPAKDAPALSREREDALDCALVLGLAFDRGGRRLGYGAGYFDRFLAGRRFPIIGLGYQAQLVDRVPTEAHDVAMTLVVTDAGVIRP